MKGKTIDELIGEKRKANELRRQEEALTAMKSLRSAIIGRVAGSKAVTTSGKSVSIGTVGHVGISGLAGPTFQWTEEIKFGFTIKFKTDEAKLKKSWEEFTILVEANKLKKIL